VCFADRLAFDESFDNGLAYPSGLRAINISSSELFNQLRPGGRILDEDLTKKSCVELAELIRTRAVSPVEVAEAHLQRIERLNPSLNAIVTLAPDLLERARAAEADLMRGKEVGPLHGLPLTLKDTIDTQGLRTTSGSRLLAKNVPGRDATVVARLRAAGAIILGKTNTPEMAIPYETDNPVFGRTNNPHALGRTPGGSSGGEAAAIAAGLSPAGIGSDLSGSIRVPAHFCGIVGLKPTTGRVPVDGHTPPVTGRLSIGACIGPMAQTVADVSLIFGVIADRTRIEAAIARDASLLRGLRIAWYADDGVAPVTDETRAAVLAAARAMTEAGLEATEEQPPGVSEGARLWTELFSRAASEELREFYFGREDEAGPKVSSLLRNFELEIGLPQRISQAEKAAAAVLERVRWREQLLRWMKTTPLILAPVGATPAFEHGARRVAVKDKNISVFRAFSYSQTFNVFGLPSVVVPAGKSAEGLPIGVQIVGRPFEEETVLAAAAAIEAALGGWQRPPQF
jgi:Asp-tRNA(Asn)/Glu-tRNA(Gln) amidotransferase A subunit family amidase